MTIGGGGNLRDFFPQPMWKGKETMHRKTNPNRRNICHIVWK